MKKEIKVSFNNFYHATDGAVYKKALTINNHILETWQDVLSCDLAIGKISDYYDKLYLLQPLDRKKDVIFLNLTQARHFIAWLKKLNDVKINAERADYDANTCLIIKK